MTDLDDKLVPKALELINKFGADIVYTRKSTEGTYDPTTGETTGSATASPTVKMTPPFPLEDEYRGESTGEEGNLRESYLAASGLGFVPQKNDSFVWKDGKTYTVVEVLPLYSGEQVAAFGLVAKF